jgi:hypothetical protein
VGSKTYKPIARTAVAQLRKDFDAFVERCENVEPGLEFEGDLYQYAYVRLCGLLEQSLTSCGSAVIARQSHSEAQRFATSYLERFDRNPRDDEILRYVGRFSKEWAKELGEWFDEEERRSRVNSLVGIRNGIAHGSSFGGSRRWFESYYLTVFQLVEWLLERFDPEIAPKV